MRELICMSFPNFRSDNRKSKICRFDILRAGSESYRRSDNLKSVGFFALVIVFVGIASRVESQQPEKVPRIGFLMLSRLPLSPTASRRSVKDCASLATWRGKTLSLSGDMQRENSDRLPALAAELVRLKVDVIVTAGPLATRAAKEATTTIPIVMAQDAILLATGSSPALRDLAETLLACQLLPRS